LKYGVQDDVRNKSDLRLYVPTTQTPYKSNSTIYKVFDFAFLIEFILKYRVQDYVRSKSDLRLYVPTNPNIL